MSDPPAQPMCASVLAGFLRPHFHDNLHTMLDEYVRAEVCFANLGVHEEAQTLIEQGGNSRTNSLGHPTQAGVREAPATGHLQARRPFGLPVEGGSLPSFSPLPMRMPTEMQVQHKPETPPASMLRGAPAVMFPLGSAGINGMVGPGVPPPPARLAQHVNSYCIDPYMRNPMTSPPFQYGAAYGCVPSHSAVGTSTHMYPLLPSPHAHSLLPSPGNGQTGGVATYPNPSASPQS